MIALLLDLGFMEYATAWSIMKSLHEARVRNEVDDVLIFVVHNDVYTVGRKGDLGNLRKPVLPVYWVERGGDITYHGPGQLVGYLIFRLESTLSDFVRSIEESIIITLGEFGIKAQRNEKHRGVWVRGRKICSIGIAVSGGVSYHGFALNINPNLEYFTYINPCGLEPGMITSMERELGEAPNIDEIKRSLVKNISLIFKREMVSTTLEELAGRVTIQYGSPPRLA